MKRSGKLLSLLSYWSTKKVCEDKDLDNEDLTDADKDSSDSNNTDSHMNDISELESEGETEFQCTSEQSSSRQVYK